MLVLNAEVLFVGSLVFLQVMSVVRGAVFKSRRAGYAVGRPRGCLAVKAGVGEGSGRQRGLLPSRPASSLMMRP